MVVVVACTCAWCNWSSAAPGIVPNAGAAGTANNPGAADLSLLPPRGGAGICSSDDDGGSGGGGASTTDDATDDVDVPFEFGGGSGGLSIV